jgi:hypothetical protein
MNDLYVTENAFTVCAYHLRTNWEITRYLAALRPGDHVVKVGDFDLRDQTHRPEMGATVEEIDRADGAIKFRPTPGMPYSFGWIGTWPIDTPVVVRVQVQPWSPDLGDNYIPVCGDCAQALRLYPCDCGLGWVRDTKSDPCTGQPHVVRLDAVVGAGLPRVQS